MGVTSSNYRDNHILCSVLRLMIHKQTYNIILKIVRVLRYNVFNQALVECLPYWLVLGSVLSKTKTTVLCEFKEGCFQKQGQARIHCENVRWAII